MQKDTLNLEIDTFVRALEVLFTNPLGMLQKLKMDRFYKDGKMNPVPFMTFDEAISLVGKELIEMVLIFCNAPVEGVDNDPKY